MPIWAWIIPFIVGGIVYPVTLPKRKRDAADRKRLFEERHQKGGEAARRPLDTGQVRIAIRVRPGRHVRVSAVSTPAPWSSV